MCLSQQQQYNFNPNKRKSPFDQNDVYLMQDSESKRLAIVSANITTSTTSNNSIGVNTGTSHQLLACQNPMLASMLAKTPTSLPEEKIQTIPPSMISSTPDVKLPPNLDKKIIPTPPTTGANVNQSSQIQQTHSNQHLSQQHQITIQQANLMQQQQHIQDIQLQIQQQQQQQHHIVQQHTQQQQHLITTIGPGGTTSLVPAPIAIKSGQQQQQQQIHHTNQSQLQQQVSNNYQ